MLVTHIHSRKHSEEYSTDYIRIFVMFPFLCICWYMNLILFVLFCFECSFVHVVSHRVFHLLFNNEPSIIGGGEQTTKPNISPQNGGPKIFTKQQHLYKIALFYSYYHWFSFKLKVSFVQLWKAIFSSYTFLIFQFFLYYISIYFLSSLLSVVMQFPISVDNSFLRYSM